MLAIGLFNGDRFLRAVSSARFLENQPVRYNDEPDFPQIFGGGNS